MKNYDTFKQYMKRLAVEYIKEYETNESVYDFTNWLQMLPETEKKEEKRWKPTLGQTYYLPCLTSVVLYDGYKWDDTLFDDTSYERRIVCKTSQEAIALAERMLEAIKN